MKEWIQEYRESLAQIRKAKKDLPNGPWGEADHRLLSGMERDLVWVLEWLTTGCQPGNRRGMENRSYDQRQVLWSQLSEKAKRRIEWRESMKMTRTSSIQRLLEQMHQLLSDSEYEAFIAVRGQALSFAQAAALFHCSKSTVQSYVRRAEQKLRKAAAEGVFDDLPESRGHREENGARMRLSDTCHTKATYR